MDGKWNGVYARQSLDKKDSLSIEMQLEKGKALFPEEDLFKEYVDKGFSGKNINRPGFQQLMEDVKKGKVKRIIVYRMDRFSRSLLDFCDTWELLAERKVEFVSVNERFDTSSPMGKAMLFILMVFAQLERETIAERVTDNYFTRSGLGHWPGGDAPTGFDLVRVTECAQKFTSLAANQYMPSMKEAFALYAMDPTASMTKVGNFLYERIPGDWSNTAISRILRNPVYVKADEAVYYFFQAQGVKIINGIDEFDGRHGALLVGKDGKSYKCKGTSELMQLSIGSWDGEIESNIWLKCQKKMLANSSKKNSGKGKYTWLSGVLKCGYCGKAMLVYCWQRQYGEYKYFTCSKRNKRCSYKGTYPRIDEVEQEVAEQIKVLFRECKSRIRKDTDRAEELKNALTANAQKIDNFLGMIGDGASQLTIQYVNAKLEELNGEKLRLTRLLTEIQSNADCIKIPKIAFDKLSFEEKKVVAVSLVQEIKVFGNKIEIKWKI